MPTGVYMRLLATFCLLLLAWSPLAGVELVDVMLARNGWQLDLTDKAGNTKGMCSVAFIIENDQLVIGADHSYRNLDNPPERAVIDGIRQDFPTKVPVVIENGHFSWSVESVASFSNGKLKKDAAGVYYFEGTYKIGKNKGTWTIYQP